MRRSAEIPIEIGRTRWAELTEAATRTARAASVAYATEEIGSDEKIGSAKNFGSNRSSSCPVSRGRPMRARLAATIGSGSPGSSKKVGSPLAGVSSASANRAFLDGRRCNHQHSTGGLGEHRPHDLIESERVRSLGP